MNDSNILFQEIVKPFYPIVTLWGHMEMKRRISPFLGSEHIQFGTSSVNIFTIGSYSGEKNSGEVNVTVIEGFPDSKEFFHANNLCVTGIIQVNKKGLAIYSDPKGSQHIPWPKGKTVVWVLLDINEVEKREVKNIRFFIEFLGKNGLLHRLIRNFQKKKYS